MNASQINGDSKFVFGVPMPKDKGIIDIPPRKEYKKVIEEGEIELDFKGNTPEIIKALEKQNGKEMTH